MGLASGGVNPYTGEAIGLQVRQAPPEPLFSSALGAFGEKKGGGFYETASHQNMSFFVAVRAVCNTRFLSRLTYE
jgi:hypothetical protein